jgi:hypothetical protein
LLLGLVAGSLSMPTRGAGNASPDGFSATSEHRRALRQEGLNNSKAYEYALDLTDTVGSRLSGSSNLRRAYDCTEARLRDIGVNNPRLEDCGEYALSWE